MDSEERKRRADELFKQAYQEQMNNNLDEAISLYKASLAYSPTAEAHTFLGWAYSFQEKIDEAIEECKKAIAVDPTLGNPYNDIGSYLIKQGKLEEAIPWLEKAVDAERYDARHYPHCNLGRVYWAQGQLMRASREFEKALTIDPNYGFASDALDKIRCQLN